MVFGYMLVRLNSSWHVDAKPGSSNHFSVSLPTRRDNFKFSERYKSLAEVEKKEKSLLQLDKQPFDAIVACLNWQVRLTFKTVIN